jgi:hypothetical protein
VYEDSTRVGTTTATRQIPVSELLARHRGEQAPSHSEWTAPAPTACETTDVIPVVQDDYYPGEPYAATGYSEAYEYVEEPADAVRPFVGVSADTDQFPMPVLHEVEGEQTLLAPIDVDAMDAERAAAKAAARGAGVPHVEAQRTEVASTQIVAAEDDTVRTPSCDDTPSREIYIRELLRREGRLPREQRRKQIPKIAAAAAGVAALCGAVAATIVHVQNADDHQNATGNGVPLTVVDNGAPHGQALDAPLSPRGTEQVTPDSSTAGGSTATDKHAAPPRVAPYVTASQQAQNGGGATSSTTPTTTSTTPPTTTTTNPPSSSSNNPPSPTGGNTNNNSTPPSTPSNGTAGSGNSTPPASTTNDTGLLGGLLNPITGVLGL